MRLCKREKGVSAVRDAHYETLSTLSPSFPSIFVFAIGQYGTGLYPLHFPINICLRNCKNWYCTFPSIFVFVIGQYGTRTDINYKTPIFSCPCILIILKCVVCLLRFDMLNPPNPQSFPHLDWFSFSLIIRWCPQAFFCVMSFELGQYDHETWLICTECWEVEQFPWEVTEK